MYDAAMEYAPEVFENKSDVRTAYRAAKNIGREQGLRGRELRQFGRNLVIDKSYANADGDVTPHVPLPPTGKVARSTMFETAQEFAPELTRKDVRGAYNIAKDWGRNLGLKGRELRQYGRNQVIDRMYNYADGVHSSAPVNDYEFSEAESGRMARTQNSANNLIDSWMDHSAPDWKSLLK